MPFNLGWWSIIFPLATQTDATYALAAATGFGFFIWVGRFMWGFLAVITLYVHTKTLMHCTDPSFWKAFEPVKVA